MQNQNVQMVMAAGDYYTGGIDGDFGVKSTTAKRAADAMYFQRARL